MKTLNEITTILSHHLPGLARQYHLKELGIFGSYVKNAQTDASDVDILVDFEQTPSLFEFVNLQLQLADLLHTNVDLVMKTGLKPQLGQRILREVVVL